MSRSNLCQCGEWKSLEARQCRSCYETLVKLGAMGCATPQPQHQKKPKQPSLCACGREKSRKAKQCIVCYTASIEPSNANVCPECGGWKHREARVCKKCYIPDPTKCTDVCVCGRRKWRKHEVCGVCNKLLERERVAARPKKRHPWRTYRGGYARV